MYEKAADIAEETLPLLQVNKKKSTRSLYESTKLKISEI